MDTIQLRLGSLPREALPRPERPAHTPERTGPAAAAARHRALWAAATAAFLVSTAAAIYWGRTLQPVPLPAVAPIDGRPVRRFHTDHGVVDGRRRTHRVACRR